MSMLEQLTTLLRPDPVVVALAIFGSVAEGRADEWSDLDALLVVEEDALATFFPAVDWLATLGTIYACSQSSQANVRHTTRLCYTDFRRLDLIITTPPALAQINTWPSVSFYRGATVVFSHSDVVQKTLTATYPVPPPYPFTPDSFLPRANAFWFKAQLAVTKIMRNDRLRGLHLALDLVRDYLTLGMTVRDRRSGTADYKGGWGNRFVDKIEPTDYSGTGILDMIEGVAIGWDQLATQLIADYEERRGPLLAAIERARRDLLNS